MQDVHSPQPVTDPVNSIADGNSAPPSLFTILPYIMLPMALAAADQTIVATALPAIVSDLGSVSQISWIIVAYLISAVTAAPVYGQLRDIYGSRLMMTVALSIYMAASLCCAFASTFTAIVVSRFLQGVGGGGLMTLSQAIIGETIPPRERARYQGYLAAVVVSATVAAPLVGGLLTSHFGWHSIFIFQAPLAGIALWVTLRGPSKPSNAPSQPFDVLGVTWFVAFIAPFLLGLDTLRQAASGDGSTAIGLLVFAALTLVGLIRQEKRAPQPLIPISLLRMLPILISNVIAFCHGAALVSLSTLLPIYLHVVKGAAAREMGLAMLPMMLGIGIGSMVSGRVVSRTGRTAILPSIGLTAATLLLVCLSLAIESWGYWQLVAVLALIGLAIGTVMSVVQITVQTVAGRERIGSAAASVQISRTLGAATGTTITGALLFATLQLGTTDASDVFTALFSANAQALTPSAAVAHTIASAFRVGFLSIALYSAFGAAMAWRLPMRRL